MNLLRRLLTITALVALTGCATPPRDTLVQYSTIKSLLAGDFDGDMTYRELRRQGDFGLGTFNALDGEMIALDGQFYQVRSDGKVVPVRDSMRTPFAVVTFFRADRSLTVTNSGSFHALEQWLDQMLPAKNAFYAIRIDGEFASIKARSVPPQVKPYPPLIEAAQKQTIFDLENVTGTLVGFRMPVFMAGLNVPGYHFHFITTDRQAGGHVLDCFVRRAAVQFDEPTRFLMVVPQTSTFQKTDHAQERGHELETVEKGGSLR